MWWNIASIVTLSVAIVAFFYIVYECVLDYEEESFKQMMDRINSERNKTR